MRFAGFFVEFGSINYPEWQTRIVDSIGTSRSSDIDKIVNYLRSGHLLVDFMRLEPDYFGTGALIDGGLSICTDGEWVWRADLAYYVDRHNVLVPGEFLNVIRASEYRVPECTDEVLDRCMESVTDVVLSRHAPPWESQ